MPGTRQLIVNADDFGLSPGVNRGIIRAHELGIVTSASLMVRRAAASEAAALARNHPRLSVGLHLDLGEWRYADDAWRPVHDVVCLQDTERVTGEVERQLAAFRDLLGRDPSHIDSHQHVHREEPAGGILAAVARRLGVVLRDRDPAVTYCGSFFGHGARESPYPEGITVDALIAVLRALPPGVTELGCHPAVNDDTGSAYGPERVVECRTLCDPRVRNELAGKNIALISFMDLSGA